MKLFKFFFLASLSMILLTGCDQKQDENYYLSHPNITKNEAAKCIDNKYSTSTVSEQCKVILSAASKLMVVMSDQQADPEGFGQKILDLENEYAKAKAALSQVKNKSTIVEAEVKFKSLENELNMMLAIAGLNSPE